MTSRKAWLFQRGVLWAMDFSRPAPRSASEAPRAPARFAEARRADAAALARAMELSDLSEVLQRFETGRRCFAGSVDGEIVTYGWLSQGEEWVGELERRYRLPDGDAYIWQCATAPRWRERGLYRALLGHMTGRLRAEGARRAWIGTNLENVPSLKAFARNGFVPVVEVAYRRLLTLGWMRLRRLAGANEELVADARRILTAPHERAWGGWIIGVGASR